MKPIKAMTVFSPGSVVRSEQSGVSRREPSSFLVTKCCSEHQSQYQTDPKASQQYITHAVLGHSPQTCVLALHSCSACSHAWPSPGRKLSAGALTVAASLLPPGRLAQRCRFQLVRSLAELKSWAARLGVLQHTCRVGATGLRRWIPSFSFCVRRQLLLEAAAQHQGMPREYHLGPTGDQGLSLSRLCLPERLSTASWRTRGREGANIDSVGGRHKVWVAVHLKRTGPIVWKDRRRLAPV